MSRSSQPNKTSFYYTFKLKRIIIHQKLVAFQHLKTLVVVVVLLLSLSDIILPSFGFAITNSKRARCNNNGPIENYYCSAPSILKLQAGNEEDHHSHPNIPQNTTSIGNKSKSTNNYGHIPPETIDEIKTYADIVTVIESYNLPFFSRSSDGYRAKCICPFHNDRNPSLNIDNSRGIYKCFSCGAGGDVFNFVREFDFISSNNSKRKEDKMSYPAAIEKVATEFCGGALAQKVQSLSFSSPPSSTYGTYHNNNNNNNHRTLTPEKRQQIQLQQKVKERVLLANSAAADFYARNLISNPAAGIARAHLSQRGITPSMVRAFALGFAPEAYFKPGNIGNNVESWGKGSLVERLKELDFTPKEILDAGLATLTSKARSRLQLSSSGSSIIFQSPRPSKNMTGAKELEIDGGKSDGENGEIEFSDLMDRFRSRLMVPIFDASGRNVIGFGGRHLESESSDHGKNKTGKGKSPSYKAAKYLNTPETPVFVKKDILFGLHSARIAIDEIVGNNENGGTKENSGQQPNLTFQANAPKIVIVEGYFDAITLYGSGIQEVVASMGTSLTIPQLKISAAALEGRGRIVLCLDNDEAGQNAVERLCTGSGIWDFLEETGVEIHVASLPHGIKDPAEFIEARGGASKPSSGQDFRKEILGNSIPWNLWFISRLISRYNPSDASSFSSVCENVATFLSTHQNAAERTKQAYEAAGQLADFIARGQGKESGDGPLKIQLESDILGMASRKASAREALARRVEEVDGEGMSKAKLARLYSGEATIPDPPASRSSSVGKKIEGSESRNGISSGMGQSGKKISKRPENSFRAQNKRTLQFGNERQSPPIAKHFSGFQFRETDAAWLGLTSERAKQNFVLGEPGTKDNRRKDIVYFNSNKYLGNERSILSNIAVKDRMAPATEGTDNPLLKPSANRLLLDAESRLLKTMVHYPSARLAMKSALANRIGDSNAFLEWTNLDREWLFQCLTDSPGREQIPHEVQEGGNALQLMDHLRNRPDVPQNAFSIESGVNYNNDLAYASPGEDIKDGQGMRFDNEGLVDSEFADSVRNKQVKNERGILDDFFIQDDELLSVELREGSASHEERAALTVQEAVAVMLKAAALKRLNQLKSEWETALIIQKQRNLPNSNDRNNLNEISRYHELSNDQLDLLCSNLGRKVSEAMTTARELTDSANALNQRLLTYCAADSVEGRINLKQREELAKALDDHIASLPEDPRPTKSGADADYVFGSDEFDNSIDSRFGGGRPGVITSAPTIEEESKSKTAHSVYDSIFE